MARLACARRPCFGARVLITVSLSYSITWGSGKVGEKLSCAQWSEVRAICTVTRNTHPLLTHQRLCHCSLFSGFQMGGGVPKAQGYYLHYLQGPCGGGGSNESPAVGSPSHEPCLVPPESHSVSSLQVLSSPGGVVTPGAPSPSILGWAENAL